MPRWVAANKIRPTAIGQRLPGGQNNTASGEFSFAAGQQAQAVNQGAFVWADSQNATFASTANDQFSVRAQGGVVFATSGTGMTIDGPVTANGILLTGSGGASIPPGMALIPAGVFTMGDSLDGERDAIPTVSITVSAFYMDVNLVSYARWQSVYYWATSHGYSFVNAGAGNAANQPVQRVDWYDSVKWCNARSQQAGLTPVYYTDAGFTQVYTNGDVDAVYPNWAANGYRLPTEAEWEKAARGGLSGQRFPWGNVITENLANYYGRPPATATIWGRTATIRPSRPGRLLTQVRWAILRRTVMGYTTWQGMCWSGVGIGMGRRMDKSTQHESNRAGLRKHPCVARRQLVRRRRLRAVCLSLRRLPELRLQRQFIASGSVV